jgi:RecA/RadA recombinase
MVLLHNLARGRIEPGIYHVFGQGATGKTTIAMCCAAGIVARGRPCAWLDTGRGFSPSRFAAISTVVAGKDLSSRVLYTKVATPLALDHALEQLQHHAATWQAGLFVLDTAFGSIGQAPEDPAIRRILWIQVQEQLARLVLLANVQKIPLLLLNTVGYKPAVDQERPTGEAILRAFAPEAVLVRPVIGAGGKTGRFTYISCDDETTYRIVAGGIEQREASAVKGKGDEEEEEMEADA